MVEDLVVGCVDPRPICEADAEAIVLDVGNFGDRLTDEAGGWSAFHVCLLLNEARMAQAPRLDTKAHLYEGYSGRGMFGEKTLEPGLFRASCDRHDRSAMDEFVRRAQQ